MATMSQPGAQHDRRVPDFFPGSGEMAARCREYDWQASPLGATGGWSQSLRTTVGIVLTSRQPMLLLWGPRLIQIYNDAFRPSLGAGGRADIALGAQAHEFWTEIWDAIGPQIDQVMTSGVATWHEDQHLPIERNGRLEDVWWTYSYSPVRDDDGRIAGILVVCQETTGRVRAEQALATANAALAAERAKLDEIVDRSPAFIAVLRGADHRFERANAEYDRLVDGRALLGRSVADALPEIVEQGFIALLDHVLATGEPYVGHAVPVRLVRAPDGEAEQRYLKFVYQALTEADGTRSGVFVHGVDITEVVETREATVRLLRETEASRAQAEQARSEAETANRAKSDFLAVMSHELRTPLNAIGGYAELIEMGIRGPVTDAQRDDLRRIQQSQRHLLSLINEVLNYARLESGTVEFETVDVPLREAFLAAEALVAPQARAKGLLLVVRECRTDLVARADVEKLRQVLVNLLSNAVKFTERGGHVVLDSEASVGFAVVHVHDTGIGIPSDKLGAIFDPFVQVHSGHTRTTEGTGLGLAISRDLARGMGGDLSARSEPGLGSTFTLTLPLASSGLES